MESFDFDAISSLQAHLSNLTGLSLAIHGRKGHVILPPLNENKILVTIKSFSNNRDTYADFIKKSIDRSAHRNDVSIFKGPGDQYFFFLPFRMHDSIFVITGGGVYLSEEDFRSFYHREGHLYGLGPGQLEAWLPEITIRKLQDHAEYRKAYPLPVQSFPGNFLSTESEQEEIQGAEDYHGPDIRHENR